MKWSHELMDFSYNLGLDIGSNFSSVVLASDFRTTSDAMVSILAGSMLAGGADVHLAGKVPTPTLAYATKDHDLGVMVTASHNPPEYNGIKLWNPDGSAFVNEIPRGRVEKWNKTGKIKEIDALEKHRRALLREFESLDLKVVVDCSNGAASVITPFILKELGADVITLNCHPSGLFPGHPSEPSEENLRELKRLVVEKHADLGIAHDGDADRFIAITPAGRYLNGDYILAIFAKILGFKRIVAPVDSSMLLENFAEVIRCPVGDANVSHIMKETGVEFGGEQSGTQIFSAWRYTPDAIYAALKFAEIAQREDLDSLISDFPEYHTMRKSVKYENRRETEEKVKKIVSEYGEVNDIDGYRVSLDNGWFLIRFSGTEPKVRVTVEHENMDEGKRIMEKILRELSK